VDVSLHRPLFTLEVLVDRRIVSGALALNGLMTGSNPPRRVQFGAKVNF
jgi:hypothetical protein